MTRGSPRCLSGGSMKQLDHIRDSEGGDRCKRWSNNSESPEYPSVFRNPAIKRQQHKRKDRNREARKIPARPVWIVVGEQAPQIRHEKNCFHRMRAAIFAKVSRLDHHYDCTED